MKRSVGTGAASLVAVVWVAGLGSPTAFAQLAALPGVAAAAAASAPAIAPEPAQAAGKATPSALRAPGLKAAAPPSTRALSLVREVEGVTEYRLPNGLQVLLAPDDAKPTTTVNMTYHVGSRHENYGETGMAHLLEHLMFKGTPTHRAPYDEFNRRGFTFNGTTWYDRTNYYASFSASEESLRWYLGWQADAMVNSFIARKDLDSEMTVVRNEMEAIENDPVQILSQRMTATMYEWHNYGKTSIGARADVEGLDISRLQAFYRQHYQPDNATLLVAGQFDVAQVKAWIVQAFGRIPKPKRVLTKEVTLEPVQDGEREVVVRRVGGVPVWILGYHTVPGLHPDAAAVELLADIMGAADAGRLSKLGGAKSANALLTGYHNVAHAPGRISFTARLPAGLDAQATRAAGVAAARALEAVADQPITAAELERARALWLQRWEEAFNDHENWGIAISESIAAGDWRSYFLMRDRIKALTLDDLNRVARERFVPSNRTLALYTPDAQPRRAPAPALVDAAAQMAAFTPQASANREAFNRVADDWASLEAATQRIELRPGLSAALLQRPARGNLVNAMLKLRLGDEASWQGQVPAYSLLMLMLENGSATLQGQALADRWAQLRTEVNFSGAPGELTARIRSDRKNLPSAIALIGEMLRQPALDAASFEEAKQMALMQARMMADVPEVAATLWLDRSDNPYPSGHPLHTAPAEAHQRAVEALTLADVQAVHAQLLNANRAWFSAAGAMDVDAVRSALLTALGDWQNQSANAAIAHPHHSLPARSHTLTTADKQNAGVLMRQAWPVRASDPEAAALRVANAAFGGGPASRLWKRLREKDGVSFTVFSHFDARFSDAHASWSLRAAFAPQNRSRVEKALSEEFARALRDGFSAGEIMAARQGLLAERKRERSQNPQAAHMLMAQLEQGVGFDVEAQADAALDAVTAEAATAAWRKHFKPEQMRSVWSGDFKGR